MGLWTGFPGWKVVPTWPLMSRLNTGNVCKISCVSLVSFKGYPWIWFRVKDSLRQKLYFLGLLSHTEVRSSVSKVNLIWCCSLCNFSILYNIRRGTVPIETDVDVLVRSVILYCLGVTPLPSTPIVDSGSSDFLREERVITGSKSRRRVVVLNSENYWFACNFTITLIIPKGLLFGVRLYKRKLLWLNFYFSIN